MRSGREAPRPRLNGADCIAISPPAQAVELIAGKRSQDASRRRSPTAFVLESRASTVSESTQTSPPVGGPPSPQRAGVPADEFAGIPGPRRSRHPALAGAAVVLAALLAWQLRADVGYALSSATVRDLGEARAVAAAPPGRRAAL